MNLVKYLFFISLVSFVLFRFITPTDKQQDIYESAISHVKSINEVKVFWNLSLGSTKSDILFLKGKPSYKINDTDWTYDIECEKTNSNFIETRNKSKGPPFIGMLFNENDKLLNVIYYVNRCISGPKLGKYKPANWTVDKIEYEYGKPTEVRISKNNLTRIFIYRDENLIVGLEQGKVVLYGLVSDEYQIPDF